MNRKYPNDPWRLETDRHPGVLTPVGAHVVSKEAPMLVHLIVERECKYLMAVTSCGYYASTIRSDYDVCLHVTDLVNCLGCLSGLTHYDR
jgi:hypothetical protein